MADFEDDFYLFDHDLNVVKHTQEGLGVISGLDVSGYSSAKALSISSGSAIIESASAKKVFATFSYTSLSFTSDASYPKKGLVFVATNSVLSISYGSPAAANPVGEISKNALEPTPPNPPAGSVLLAEVWIPTNAALGSECTIFNYDIKPFKGWYVLDD